MKWNLHFIMVSFSFQTLDYMYCSVDKMLIIIHVATLLDIGYSWWGQNTFHISQEAYSKRDMNYKHKDVIIRVVFKCLFKIQFADWLILNTSILKKKRHLLSLVLRGNTTLSSLLHSVSLHYPTIHIQIDRTD